MLCSKDANEAHPATTAVKSLEAAAKLLTVVGMDIKFMVGCDKAWSFPDDDQPNAAGPAAGPAGPAMAALSLAAADDLLVSGGSSAGAAPRRAFSGGGPGGGTEDNAEGRTRG